MATITMAKAINSGLRIALARDEKVVLMGEDIGFVIIGEEIFNTSEASRRSGSEAMQKIMPTQLIQYFKGRDPRW